MGNRSTGSLVRITTECCFTADEKSMQNYIGNFPTPFVFMNPNENNLIVIGYSRIMTDNDVVSIHSLKIT